MTEQEKLRAAFDEVIEVLGDCALSADGCLIARKVILDYVKAHGRKAFEAAASLYINLDEVGDEIEAYYQDFAKSQQQREEPKGVRELRRERGLSDEGRTGGAEEVQACKRYLSDIEEEP